MGTWNSREALTCSQGHDFDEDNTRWRKYKGRYKRVCRKCAAAATQRYRERKEAKALYALFLEVQSELNQGAEDHDRPEDSSSVER